MSQGRYSEWTVDRIEQLPARRVSKGGAEEGMRDYSIIKCVNNCGAELKMLTNGKQKAQVIEDHLAVCQAVPDKDRPAKKPRAVSLSTLSDRTKCQKLAPDLHSACERRIGDLETMVTTQNGRIDTLERRADVLEEAQVSMLARAKAAYDLPEPLSLDNVVAKVVAYAPGPKPPDMPNDPAQMTTEQRMYTDRMVMQGSQIAFASMISEFEPYRIQFGVERIQPSETPMAYMHRLFESVSRSRAPAGATPTAPRWSGELAPSVDTPLGRAFSQTLGGGNRPTANVDDASATQASTTGASIGSGRVVR